MKTKLTKEKKMDVREVTVRVKYLDIRLVFMSDTDHLGRDVFSVTAWSDGDRFWHESYNRHYPTRQKFDAAFNRFSSRSI